MGTLTASSLKVFFEKNQKDKDKDRSFWCCSCPVLKHCVLSRSEIRVLGFRNLVCRGFPLSVSISAGRTIRCISSSLSSSQPTEESRGDEEIQQTVDTIELKTVHVKFQLNRECSFGEQFFMVGDDPMFGLWVPSNAVPLNWSDGHVWEVELDMPCDNAIKYKFILKGIAGVILWQPGPDRAFQPWRTSKVITVSEDWENAELQTIVEEDSLPDVVEESLVESPGMIDTENSLQPGPDLCDGMDKKPNSTNEKNCMNPTEIELAEKPIALIAENISEGNEESGVDSNGFSSGEIATDANNLVSLGADDFEKHVPSSINGENLTLFEIEENLDSEIAIPVLVPGLTPSAEEEEEECVKELDKDIDSNASLGSDKDVGFGLPEVSLEEERWRTCVSIPEVENAVLANDKQEFQGTKGVVEEHSQLGQHDNDQTDNKMESDIQWGRRTLQQFLTTLGFL